MGIAGRPLGTIGTVGTIGSLGHLDWERQVRHGDHISMAREQALIVESYFIKALPNLEHGRAFTSFPMIYKRHRVSNN